MGYTERRILLQTEFLGTISRRPVYHQSRQTMPQPGKLGDGEPFVVIFETEKPEEATILRGLLQSGGIESPSPTFSDPFPLPTHSEITHGTEVLVRISQVEAAREILASYGEKDPSV